MNKIIIHEVGPRDGLQAEKAAVPLETKMHWIERLCATGVDIVQLGSFVNPEKVTADGGYGCLIPLLRW